MASHETLPKHPSPEPWWLGDHPFLSGAFCVFSGSMLVLVDGGKSLGPWVAA